MISNKETLNFSPYMAIYDIVDPKDNMLCQINELVILQGAMTIFAVNIKRIITLIRETE